MTRPLLRLAPGRERRLKAGHPWAYSNELVMKPEYRHMQPGTIVRLESSEGWRFGTFFFNPHSLMAARKLDRDPEAVIDAAWVRRRIAEAIDLRSRVCDTDYHRLVHAEADRLPGLIIDRFGDVAVLAANTAGMDLLTPHIVTALRELLPLRGIIARNDSSSRALENLPQEVKLLWGEADNVLVYEGGVAFPVDLLEGQKTGFFFDQRQNRDMIAALAPGARMLDVFCHTGAFGLRCAAAGAASVTLVDVSAPALEQVRQAATMNNLENIEIIRDDAFDAMAKLAEEERRFDLVVCDPPAFAKSKKDQDEGLRAYGRIARAAAKLVEPGGYLFLASCSHHAPMEQFAVQIAYGIHRASREARILATVGAGPDHPVHPQLPESAYLKGQLFQLF